jgi:hypothetical protein
MHTRNGNKVGFILIGLAAALLAACMPRALPSTGTSASTINPAEESMQALRSTIRGESVVIQISSQRVAADGTLTLGIIDVLGPSWVVVYNDDGKGKRGEIVGELAVTKGKTEGLKVHIDASKATPFMFIMLHTDKGQIGTFEFPGPDVPLLDDYKSEFVIQFKVHP